jgi:hypothetical protein
MKKLAVSTVFALSLVSCATSPTGNYLQKTAADQQRLAGDAVKQLSTLWPPAKTELSMQQDTPDAFGTALVKGLRESGYSLMEYNPKAAKKKAPAGATLPLRYVLDQAGNSGLYRLTLTIGTQTITRPYFVDGGAFVPAGYWARKE